MPKAIIGSLAANSDFAVIPSQRDAWLQEVQLLKSSLIGLDGSLFLWLQPLWPETIQRLQQGEKLVELRA
jgi:hypothetical protein